MQYHDVFCVTAVIMGEKSRLIDRYLATDFDGPKEAFIVLDRLGSELSHNFWSSEFRLCG